MSAHIAQFRPEYSQEIRDIFFESSTRKKFKSDEERENFYDKYVGFYLEHFPELCLVYFDQRVLGYVLGCHQSDRDDLIQIQPHLKIFQDLFANYPAHLHINCHSEARGKGVGGKLLEEFVRKLPGVGVHIMTSPDSQNVGFYRKHGFGFEVTRAFQSAQIHFMGRLP